MRRAVHEKETEFINRGSGAVAHEGRVGQGARTCSCPLRTKALWGASRPLLVLAFRVLNMEC